MKNNTSKLLAGVCRWSARILGTLLVLTLLAFAVGEGMPNPFTQPLRVQLGFAGLGLIMLGMIAGWRWELPGGIVSLAGWGLFVMAVVRFPRGPNVFIYTLAVPAVLYLASALLRHHSQRPSPA